MSNSTTQDLIVDGAELSHPITIKRGKTSRIHQVVAYPTQLTRKTTNGFADGTTTPDEKTVKKCRWHTAGIIRFHLNPETNKIYEARPSLHELEITLECLLDESHKEQLAKRAEQIYGLEFTADNFVICPFQTFMAQLTVPMDGIPKTYYGVLVDNKELHPMRIIFDIKDPNEISEIASKLDHPRDHDIVLRYDYSLSGTSTARAALTISAEDINKIDLEKQVFGKSEADSMVVSRSVMDKITASISTQLRVVEDIGVGGSSFGQDLIQQEIARAMSSSGFQKFSMDDIIQMKNNDMEISDDLKANIINSTSSNNSDSSSSSHHNIDQSSSANSSDMLHEKSDSNRNAGGQSTSSSSSFGLNATIGGFGGGFNTSSSNSQATNFDNSNSSANKDHEILSKQSSNLNDNSASNSSSTSRNNAVQGEIRQVKDIDAAIVRRSEISKGFTISLQRFHHQLATTSIKGRLTTKVDTEILEDIQAKEQAEREKQAKREEEENNAKERALRQELELTPQQIDDLLHEIDSLDEDQLKEMYKEFVILCPNGKMSREIFTSCFQKLHPGGKVNNYCRYSYSVFDTDNTGAMNFTEYVRAMHAHGSDDIEESLRLAFDVFDYDKSGKIDQKEILHILTATGDLLGRPLETANAKTLAKKILDTCDKQRNGKISKEEFVNGCKNIKEYCQFLIPNFEQVVTSHDPNYQGDLEYGKKNGQGVYTWPDGRRYEGQWKEDKQHGKGTLKWPDGRQYEGDWLDGVRNGQGIETSADGDRFEGEWRSDKKNGKGIETSADGDRFEGEWRSDKRNGKGVYIWSDGRRYEGQWKDDQEGNTGVYAWPDGRRYEGEIKDDVKHGYGTETLANGDRYEGQWTDAKKNGKGVYIWSNGNRYEGDWKDDIRTGKGVFINSKGNRYEGDYKNDKMNGKGVYIWADGDRYEGDFKDGNSHGKGVFTSTDGSRYEGGWKDDKKHGKGVQTFANGAKFEGEWQNGERNATGRLTLTNGTYYTGHISDDFIKQAKNNQVQGNQCNQVQWTYYTSS
ncbi:hypothetical protein I4U23_023109 [Adineta vaga]|nr:hypothetical protein I4U23_023109 [Adineta vaga]